MQDFQYAAPATIGEAVKLLSGHNGKAKLLAGGTDIIVQLRERMRTAELVIDLKRIPELLDINYSPAQGLKLGAAATCAAIYDHRELPEAYPGLVDAARIIGGWQIQTRASIGGNLCNSSPAADSIPVLLALNVVCHIEGPGGRRTVPIASFCTAPGKNVLASADVLVALEFPPRARGASSAYERFIPRNEMDIAVVGAGTWVQLSPGGDAIAAARIGLGAVAPTPRLAEEAAAYLVGKSPTAEVFAAAGERAKKVASPIDDMRGTKEYRTHLVGVLVKRTLARAVERARSAS